ncbi:hypothetical protein RSOLAG1IB_12186 [Rhizoctonia solani AG-1 IB]|uniref:DUF6532 domain-containing protein n=1 Tax=Thanatephorus cucumeris (strain AG1-IB / isolate 7/3/14) TaxID=1108050 RepID=M5CBT6_THACB|nr:hypothetical protein BN14_10893 [Rhizoctonia solani AG-1 IB]CEL58716.1 hypothetical protein RSOLAG1IB_12186 [Rhizoctonia solani AG-1 IB]
MEALVATVCAFPDDETRWRFAVLSNYWASKKLGRHYRLQPDSEHCRLLYSRISQSRGRLVSAAFSDGIRYFYTDLTWDTTATGQAAANAQEALRKKVADMIKTGAFTTARGRPTAYYQSEWFTRILKQGYFATSSSKGLSNDPHLAECFGQGISYPLFALVATATERMLAVVAAGPSGIKSSHKSPSSAFSHNTYSPRYFIHVYSLARINGSPAGLALNKYLKQVHTELRSIANPSVRSGPALSLAIPISALNHYDENNAEKSNSNTPAVSSAAPQVHPPPAPGIDWGIVLSSSSLDASQKVEILSAIYALTAGMPRIHVSSPAIGASADQTHLANAPPGTRGRPKATTGTRATRSDKSSKRKGKEKAVYEDNSEAEDQGAGEGEEEVQQKDEGAEDEDEAEAEAEGEAESGAEGEAEDAAESGAEDEADSGAVAASETDVESQDNNKAGRVDRNKGEDDGETSSGVDGASDGEPIYAKRPRAQRNILPKSLSGLSSAEDIDEDESDGNGASGAAGSANDADQTMMTAVASDYDED